MSARTPWRTPKLPSTLTALVLAALVTLSVVAWFIIDAGIDRQDQELLKEQTNQAVLLLQRDVEQTSLLLGSVGVGATVFNANANALRTRPDITVVQVTKGRPDAQGNVTPGPPRVNIVVGSALHRGPLTGKLAQIALAARPTLSSSPVIHLAGNPYVVFSIVPPAIGLPGYAALELMRIHPGQASPTNGPYHHLDLALYATPIPQRGQLIASTTGRKPLPQPTTSTVLRVGSLQWAAVGGARTPLLDRWAQATPWIVLSVGLGLALGLAVTVETLLRRQRAQRDVAETLQAALLPETLPQLDGTETAVRYLPGTHGIHVGGDWYDVISLDEAHLLAVVGDVTGHGLEAATVMANLLYATRAYAADGDKPEVILSKLSGLLSVDHSGQFATVLFILIDLDAQTATVVNGGHPPPLMLRDDHSEYVDSHTGLPVGVMRTTTYVPVTAPFSPGTTLLAFTDGLIERRGENLDVGLDRLATAAATANPHGSLDALLSTVMSRLVGRGVADDTVLLGIRWPTRAAEVELPFQRPATSTQANA